MGSNLAWFNYKKAGTLTWELQVKLEPGQAKTINCVEGTLSWDTNFHKIIIEGEFSCN